MTYRHPENGHTFVRKFQYLLTKAHGTTAWRTTNLIVTVKKRSNVVELNFIDEFLVFVQFPNYVIVRP
jgi:hypothetical protein